MFGFLKKLRKKAAARLAAIPYDAIEQWIISRRRTDAFSCGGILGDNDIPPVVFGPDDGGGFSFGEDISKMLVRRDETFSEMLFRLIREKGITDVECYSAAEMTPQHFSKIRCNKNYLPNKTTVIALALALQLDQDDTEDLLRSAGYALSYGSEFDLIIMYCLAHGIYDVWTVNEILDHFDQKPLVR